MVFEINYRVRAGSVSKFLFGLIKMEVRFPSRARERNVFFSEGLWAVSHSASFGRESQVL